MKLFTDVASALEAALATFTVLDESTYASKALGSSQQIETMSCDCTGAGSHLCDEESDCINRLTSVECVGDHNGLGPCQNRRFQDKKYASVDVFNADKKGFGVRALAPISEGDLIYEYVGEVVDESRFMKRRRQYEQKGIKHFYFMMLNKDEFIDATLKGSIARFCNHSCKPNSYVDKWVVGPKLRMGIFAKRDIVTGEEITFDYNVDRYGAEPQTCYCGEDNCVGVIGGKKQTAGLHIPQSIYDALGLDPEDEEEWMSTVSKQKKKDLDDTTAMLLPVKSISDPEEVSNIMSVLMQSRDSWVVKKLASRILETEDTPVQMQVLRMHGYEIFGTLLNQWQSDEESLSTIMHILKKWPKLTRNKISSSKIEGVVATLAKNTELPSEISEIAASLLQEWSSLEMAYRIPRQKREKSDSKETTPAEPEPAVAATAAATASPSKIPARPRVKLPPGWEAAYSEDGEIYYYNRELNQTSWEKPRDPRDIERDRQREQEREKQREQEAKRVQLEKAKQEEDLQKIIEEAASSLANELEPPTPADSDDKTSSPPSPVRAMTRTLAAYIPKLIWKHEGVLGRDLCKRYAKEIVQLLVEKETKKGSVALELTDDKKKKIKAFTASYMEKVLAHQKQRQTKRANAPDSKTIKRSKVSS